MRRTRQAAAPIALLALFLLTFLPIRAAAAPQTPEPRVHREIVVVGSEPTHHRVILDQLADRGYLGVSLLNLTPELRRHFGAPGVSGVLVSRVEPESPAAAAGLAVGDVITSIDGEPLRTTSQLVGRVGRRREGDEVELEIVRGGVPRTLRVTLSQSERRQVEVGQFVWRGTDEGPLVVDLNPEVIERVIAVDPETINESVQELLEGLEARGAILGGQLLDVEQRTQLEKRIAELEERLHEMERRIRHRHRDDE